VGEVADTIVTAPVPAVGDPVGTDSGVGVTAGIDQVLHLAVVPRGADGSARCSDPWRSLPNVLTALRLVLTLPISWAVLTNRFTLALVLFVIAGLSDALDGWLARRFNWQSQLGAFLDPAADKILMGLVFILLAFEQHIAAWFAALVVGRDLVIALGAVTYRAFYGPF